MTSPGGPPFQERSSWHNHTKNQSVEPVRIYDAQSLADLVSIVKNAEAFGMSVRAVGSGHSWSDVALTNGFLIKTHRLKKLLDLEAELLLPGVDTRHLVRVEAGITIRDLNRALYERKLALKNMGGYDAQTVAGVMSTATHGSGLEFGPIADAAVSIDLVASGGRLIRVEPAAGISTRAPDGWEPIVHSDDWFDAVRVGLGCMGLIYAVTLEVGDSYWLKEIRRLADWSEVRETLLRPPLDQKKRFEVYLNPYTREGRNRCLVTTREETDPRRRPPWGGRRRNSLPEFFATLKVTPKFLNFVTDRRPDWTPRLLDWALNALADKEYTNVSFKVLNIGTANLLPTYSSEIGVQVDDDGTHLEAVERVIEVAGRHARCGKVYETSPISLRFVKASSAYMAMMHDRTTMMIELIQSTRTEGGLELLAAYEEALYELGGRPHWGQVNTLTGSHDLVRSMYRRLDDWSRVHGEINASGVFDSPFSKRIGISTSRYVAPGGARPPLGGQQSRSL
jgi:hypothetical protein